MHAQGVTKFREIGIQIGLELVHEYEQLCVAEFAKSLYVCRIDEDRTLRFHRGERGLHKTINRLAETEIFSRYTDASSLQPLGIKVLTVVEWPFIRDGRRRGIIRVRAGNHCKQ